MTSASNVSRRLLLNYDVASLYPNLVRIFGYSSRNQEDKDAYVEILKTRIAAKHGKLSEDFLNEFGVTMKEVNTGLKLPINAYTGTLRASFNPLYDNLQGFSICITGQLLILQLIHDLQQVPTLEMVEANTDAVKFYIDEEYKSQAEKVLQDWQDLTGLELEEDNVVKCVARDVNNFAEILQTGDNDYEVHYKGGEFRGEHKFEWDKETHTFHYSCGDSVKSNSLTVCAEAMLKNLLFNIPVEDTINACNDIFRFQMISHLGSTYEKCVLEDKDGNQTELQRNNRIYAGKIKNNNKIYKIKPDGRKDSLGNCPKNPVVDNKNELTIEDIDKTWYIKYTKQRISEFKGEKDVYMEEKLDKLKKDELIAYAKELQEKLDNYDTVEKPIGEINEQARLAKKIVEFRKRVRNRNFILDAVLPSNLGGKEYYSIDQIYQAVQDISIEVGLDFQFDVVDVDRLDLGAFKPATRAPQNIATVKCEATFMDIDTGAWKTYTTMAQGSDSIDKAVSGAASYAFRTWFDKNFTPCIFNDEKVEYANGVTPNVSIDAAVVEEPKTVIKPRVYVAPEKKEEIKQEIVSTPQKSESQEDVEKLTALIYEYRELSGNESAGKNKLDAIVSGSYTDLDIMNWTLSFENAIAEYKKGN